MTTLRKEEPVYSFESKIMKLKVKFSIRSKDLSHQEDSSCQVM